MTHSTKVLIFTLLKYIVFTSAAAFFNPLLTTTTTPTHISDFRNLPRSDSRANKPDVFPGFDFLDKSTTERARTPLDFYTKVIGRIVNQGRQTYERIVNNVQKYEIKLRANLKRDSETMQNVTDSFMLIREKLKPSNWTKKYFSSILTATGLDKLQNASDPQYLSKAIDTFTTYINHTKVKLHPYNKSTNRTNDTNTNVSNDESYNKTNPPLGFTFAFVKFLNLHENRAQTSNVSLGKVNNTMGDDLIIDRIDERKENDDIEDINDDDESNDNENDASSFGIFILEIFGTIAGLTWGAFSQIQNLFTQNRKLE